MNWNLSLMNAAVVFFLAGLTGCMGSTQLLSKPAHPEDVTGVYDLYLYGCRHQDMLENVAILVKKDSKYAFEIFDIDSIYTVQQGVPASEALKRATAFIRCSMHQVWQTDLRAIPDGSGGIIGYEARPLYAHQEFGFPDVLLTSYALKNDMIRAYIRMDPHLERRKGPFDVPTGSH